jgi:hypothetical protein
VQVQLTQHRPDLLARLHLQHGQPAGGGRRGGRRLVGVQARATGSGVAAVCVLRASPASPLATPPLPLPPPHLLMLAACISAPSVAPGRDPKGSSTARSTPVRCCRRGWRWRSVSLGPVDTNMCGGKNALGVPGWCRNGACYLSQQQPSACAAVHVQTPCIQAPLMPRSTCPACDHHYSASSRRHLRLERKRSILRPARRWRGGCCRTPGAAPRRPQGGMLPNGQHIAAPVPSIGAHTLPTQLVLQAACTKRRGRGGGGGSPCVRVKYKSNNYLETSAPWCEAALIKCKAAQLRFSTLLHPDECPWHSCSRPTWHPWQSQRGAVAAHHLHHPLRVLPVTSCTQHALHPAQSSRQVLQLMSGCTPPRPSLTMAAAPCPPPGAPNPPGSRPVQQPRRPLTSCIKLRLLLPSRPSH